MALPGDDVWWPPALDIFDFSLKFEETTFQILPSSLFIIGVLAAFLYYRRQPVYIHDGPLLWLKLFMGLVLAGLQIALLILRLLFQDCRIDTTSAAASVDLVAALGLVVILFFEHRHAIRSSAFTAVYIALRILFDATQSRSFFKRSVISVAVLYIMAAVIRLSLLILEEVPKINLIIDPIIRNSSGGEATSGFWSRSLYVYLGPVFRIGARGILLMENLVDIGIEFDSQLVHDQLSEHWKRGNWKKPNALFFACCWAWRSAILAALIPRLLLSGLLFGQPFTMQRVINSVEYDDQITTQSKAGLVGATILTFCGSPICKAIAMQMIYRLLTRVRGGLLSHLMHKSLRLKMFDAQQNAAVTLMTADFDGISQGFPLCFDIPFSFIESGFGIYFLTKFIKQAGFVIIFPLIFATFVGFVLGKFMAPALKEWNQCIQVRVTKTSQVLSQLPALKTLGLGPKALEFIQHLRKVEIETSKRYRSIQSISISAATLADLLTGPIIIAAGLFWNTLGDRLIPSDIYPALAIVVIVQAPMTRVFRAYPLVMAMMGCFDRIQVFLAQDEHNDQRVLCRETPRAVTRIWPTVEPSTPTTRTVQRDANRVIHLEGVSLAPCGSKRTVLSNANLSIAPASTTTVFGATGSGKSTLLDGILGEAEIKGGTLYIDDVAIALAGQSPYLPNLSIRECILGACEYDEAWFKTVITDCQLLEDLEQLPGRENYIVGTGGLRLSGGQRMRVAIARAVFARAAIVLLDDPFSSLDRTTATSILNSLCGRNGLFKRFGSTVILTSYLPECLDLSDSVVYLDGTGKLTCEHNKVDLGLRSQIMKMLRKEGPKSAAGELQETQLNQTSTSGNLHHTAQSARNSTDEKQQNGDWRLYRFWMRELSRMSLLLWFSCGCITGLCDVIPVVYLKYWIANAPSNRFWYIGYVLLPVALAVVAGFGWYYLLNHLCPRASLGLHKKVTNTVVGATFGFLTTTDTGSILSRFSVDMDLLTKKIPPSLNNTFYWAATSISQAGVALSVGDYLLILLPFIIIALYCFQRYYLRTSRQLRRLDLEAQATLVTALREASDGVTHIRSFGWQGQTLEKSLYLLSESQKPIYLLYSAQQYLSLVTGVLAGITGVVLAVVTLYRADRTTGNSAGFSFLAIVGLGDCFRECIMSWTGLETAIGSLSRVRSFMAKTATESDAHTVSLPEFWPSRGEIEMTGVSARYRSDERRQRSVLQNVSLSIPAGQKIGFKGRTGSGKSSLLYTLLGFLEYDGKITIDGIDIATAPRDELRARIITISQDQVELDGTVRDNLLPFDKTWGETAIKLDEKGQREAVDKDTVVRETLVRLGMWDKVNGMGGLGALMKDVGYSHGEKQLMCIARAVVRRRLTGGKLVLVDEATSTIDGWREQIVREMMNEYFQGCTIVVVAHHEESIADANVTVQMKNGTIETTQRWF